MKLSLSFLTICLSFFASAQGLNGEVAFNDNYSQASSNLVCVDEFSYLVKRQDYTASFFTSAELYKIDTLENVLWIAPISPISSETVQVNEMIASENGGVYVLGLAKPTCDVPSNCVWFIQKFDPNGNLAWTKTWDDILCFEVSVRGMALTNNNEILVNFSDTGGSKFYTISNGGVFTDSLAVSISNFGKILDFSSYEKIAKLQNLLFGFDGNGASINSRNFSSVIRGMEVQNDSLFLITSDSVFILDASFQTILQTQIPSFSNYSTMKIDPTKIRLLSSTPSTQSILTLDHQFQLIDELTIFTNLPTTADKDFSSSHFAASYDYNLTSFSSVRHQDFSLQSSADTSINTTDIGIVGFDPYQIITSPNSFSPPDFYNVSISANVLVKNFGDNVLNNCRINYFIGPSYACGFRCFNEEFTNLNLAPGDSMWVNIGTFLNEVTYVTGDPLVKEICVYTSHPNNKTDLVVPNDSHCTNLVLGNAALADNTIKSLVLYPNPTQSLLHLDTGSNAAFTYEIFDIRGHLVMRGTTLNDRIDVADLATGMYIIYLSSIDGLEFSPANFIKQ